MRRLFVIPFISALLGAGVAVAVIAAFGGLDKTEHVTTTIQAAPLQPSNASQQTPTLTPHDIYVRDAPGVVFVTSTIVQKPNRPSVCSAAKRSSADRRRARESSSTQTARSSPTGTWSRTRSK